MPEQSEDFVCRGDQPLGDEFDHCRCWLDLERLCCRCGVSDDDPLCEPALSGGSEGETNG